MRKGVLYSHNMEKKYLSQLFDAHEVINLKKKAL